MEDWDHCNHWDPSALVRFRNGTLLVTSFSTQWENDDVSQSLKEDMTEIDCSQVNVPTSLISGQTLDQYVESRSNIAPLLAWVIQNLQNPKPTPLMVFTPMPTMVQSRLATYLAGWLGPSVIQLGGCPVLDRITVASESLSLSLYDGPCIFVSAFPTFLSTIASCVYIGSPEYVPTAPTVTLLTLEWTAVIRACSRIRPPRPPMCKVECVSDFVMSVPNMNLAIQQARLHSCGENASIQIDELPKLLHFIENDCVVGPNLRTPLKHLYEKAKQKGIVPVDCHCINEWIMRPSVMQTLLSVRANVTSQSRNLKLPDNSRYHGRWVTGLDLK